MALDRLPEHKSVHRLAFDHYLRTGERLTNAEWLARYERKFNPYHDEIGRFTSPPGVTVSWGSHALQLAARAPDRTRPATPTSGNTIPPGGQIIAEGGLRAAQQAREVMRRAQNRVAPVRPPVKALLSQIAKGEGVSDEVARRHGFASSYDVPFNYGRYAKQTKPLTQMTLKEVDELQTRILNNPANTHNASPVGKYQFVRKSLR